MIRDGFGSDESAREIMISMRIASLCLIPPRESAEWLRIESVARIMKSNGHEVEFLHFCRSPSSNQRPIPEDTIVHRYSPATIFDGPLKHLRMIRNCRYDLVYANTLEGGAYAALGKMTNIPLVVDVHGDILSERRLANEGEGINAVYLESMAKRAAAHVISLHFADKLVCVSRRMITALKGLGIPERKLAYVPNGVDLKLFRPHGKPEVEAAKHLLGLDGRFVFGYAGEFQKWQGVEALLEAARMNLSSKVSFLVVGGVSQLRETNLVVVSRVPHSNLSSYYAACDVMVLPRPAHPATEVASPTKFAEYAAMGKPVLTTNVGDASDFVRKYQCGFVVENNSPACLARGFCDALETPSQELASMGRNSRRLAETEFSWSEIAKQLLETIEGARSG